MIKSIFTLCIIVVSSLLCFAQSTIDIFESTIKVSGVSEENFYYGFAEGDQLIFNFQELNNKELKELEIIELPTSSKFMDYKTRKIENKTLQIPRTGIYCFRFSNSALGGRVCRIKIQRIPANEATRNFNSTVYWRMVYDTIVIPRQESFIEKSDTVSSTIVDQIAKISSQTSINGNPNRILVDFTLPDNTIAWSYYIGVGKEGMSAYESAKDQFISSATTGISQLASLDPMIALALNGLSVFSKIQGRDNVKYYFISDWNSVLAFNAGRTFYQYKLGDVVNDASQMKAPLNGKVYLGLINDNLMEPIEVIVKVVAIQVNQKIGTRTVIDKQINAHREGYLKQ